MGVNIRRSVMENHDTEKTHADFDAARQQVRRWDSPDRPMAEVRRFPDFGRPAGRGPASVRSNADRRMAAQPAARAHRHSATLVGCGRTPQSNGETLNEHGLTRRQQKRRERLERVADWHREKVADTREQEINQAWRQHREFLKTSDHGNAATSAGVSRGNNHNGKQGERDSNGGMAR